MFVVVKNNYSDKDLSLIGNTAMTVPIAWWWERIEED